jgi:hypothetical protein
MVNKEKYKLVGTMNLYNSTPDFVYAIFKRNDKYYFENSDDSLEITSFEEVVGKDQIEMIESLDSKVQIGNSKRKYYVGDEPIVAYQTSEDEIFIGNIEEFFAYAESEDIQQDFVKSEAARIKREKAKRKELKFQL